MLMFVCVYMCLLFLHPYTCTDVWEWIEQMREQVCDLERRVRLAKANVEQITTTMAAWSQAPLYQRKEDKKDYLLGLEVSYPPTSTFVRALEHVIFMNFYCVPIGPYQPLSDMVWTCYI